METNKRTIARIASYSIIAMAVVAGIGYGYAFNSFYKPDASTTINILNQSSWLLQLTIASFTVILLLDIVVSWALYELFKHANKSFSLLIALFRLVYTAVLAVSICYLLNALELVKSDQPNEGMILFHLNMFLSIWSWGLIIFGCHLFLLGMIVSSSGLFPRAVGYFTSFAGICYFLHSSFMLLVSFYECYEETMDAILALPMALGELILAFCLIRGESKKVNN